MKGPTVKGPAHYLTSPSLYPSGPGRFISLRTKFVVFFSLIIILTCSGMSWYFIHSKRIAMTERVKDLGTILVKNLAHNVRYGIIIEDRVILEQFIDGVMGCGGPQPAVAPVDPLAPPVEGEVPADGTAPVEPATG